MTETKGKAKPGEKLARFQRIVAKLEKHPGDLAGSAALDAYGKELNQLISDFQALPFDASAHREEAKQIVQLYQARVERRYRGLQYNLITASVAEIIQRLLE